MTRKSCLKKTDDRRRRRRLGKDWDELDKDGAGASANAFQTSAEIGYVLTEATKSLLRALVRFAKGDAPSDTKETIRENLSTMLPVRAMNAKF